MNDTMQIRRTAQVVTCGSCGQPTRNSCRTTLQDRGIRVDGYRCDGCVKELPYTIERPDDSPEYQRFIRALHG